MIVPIFNLSLNYHFVNRSCVCACLIFCFSSVAVLRCMALLPITFLKYAVFCWRKAQTSTRKITSDHPPNPQISLHGPKVCLRLFIFSSVARLHCTTLLSRTVMKFASCWSSPKQMLPREPSTASLCALAIFYSLPALQRRQNSTQSRR